MGIFRPIISKGLEIEPTGYEPTDSWLTPANAMTAARPLLALKAAEMLLRGKRPVTPVVFFMGMSDGEGNMARALDKYKPEWHIGTSTKGAEYDPIADTAAILIVSSAALFAPRMPVVGRAAIATALGHEGRKVAWAIGKNNLYKEVAGERLHIPPSLEGKESMAEKLSAIGLAVLASDFDNQYARQTLSASAMALAVTGARRAEGERLIYDGIADSMIAEAAAAPKLTIVHSDR